MPETAFAAALLVDPAAKYRAAGSTKCVPGAHRFAGTLFIDRLSIRRF